MKLFTAIYNDARLLGHFLAHYDKVGITEFFIAAGVDFTEDIHAFSQRYNITVYDDLDTTDTFIGEVSAVTEMRRRHQCSNEWVIIVDLDEFVEFPDPLLSVIKLAETEKANVVKATMWDRLSSDGRPAGFDATSDLTRVFPVRALLVKYVMFGRDDKSVLVKGLLRSGGAHHWFHDEVACSRQLDISHYKWFEGAIGRVREAREKLTAANVSAAVEYARLLDHYEQHGRFVWEECSGEYVAPPLPASIHAGHMLSAAEITLISDAIARRDGNLELFRGRLEAADAKYAHLWAEYEYYLKQTKELEAQIESAAQARAHIEPELADRLIARYTLSETDVAVISSAISRRNERIELLSQKNADVERRLAHTWKEYEYYLEKAQELEKELKLAREQASRLG